MGSAEESGPAAKPPTNPKAPSTTTAATHPPAKKAEMPAVMSYNDWPSSVQAYYASGSATAAATPTAFFSPSVPAYYAGGQLVSPYVTPISYSPMFTHGAVYAHPSIPLGTTYRSTEPEGRPADGKYHASASKSKGAAAAVPGKSGDGGKVTSGSVDEDTTQSGETGSEGSSDTGDEGSDLQGFSAARKRNSTTGEATQAGAQYSSTASESSHSGRVSKLPVSAPGRAALPGPATNLNIGMDLWNAPHARAAPVDIGPSAVNIAPALAGREGVMPGHQWMQLEERELKRQKRKQSNRESARRSRMRKQQECEELTRKVAELNGENIALRVELEKVKRDSSEVRAENVSIMKMLRSIKPDLLTKEELADLCGHEGNNGDPSASVGEGSGYVLHQSPVGQDRTNG